MSNVILPYRELYAIVIVKDDVFDSACELQNEGLIVDTVLPRKRCVMGWCSRSIFERLRTHSRVESLDHE